MHPSVRVPALKTPCYNMDIPKKVSALVPDLIQRGDKTLQDRWIDLPESLLLHRFQVRGDPVQQGQALVGDSRRHLPSILRITLPLDQLEIFGTIQQPGNVWHPRDQSLGHLTSAQSLAAGP